MRIIRQDRAEKTGITIVQAISSAVRPTAGEEDRTGSMVSASRWRKEAKRVDLKPAKKVRREDAEKTWTTIARAISNAVRPIAGEEDQTGSMASVNRTKR